jgi:hypothetical protein
MVKPSFEPCRKVRANPFRRTPIPQFRDTAALTAAIEYLVDTCEYPRTITPDDGVRALFHCDRPLRVAPQRQTGDAQRGCFFLQPTRVGQHESCSGYEPDHV